MFLKYGIGDNAKSVDEIQTVLRKDKGKAAPLPAWTGPEGSRRLRLPDFETIGTRRW
jgi:hypothetical protein